jgi:DNA-binding response OmpR family regulator
MMPGLDGHEVLRQLRADTATQDISVIFVTALDDAADEERGLALGAVDCLTKPITPPIALARARMSNPPRPAGASPCRTSGRRRRCSADHPPTLQARARPRGDDAPHHRRARFSFRSG